MSHMSSKSSLKAGSILLFTAVTLSACGLFNRGQQDAVMDPLPAYDPALSGRTLVDGGLGAVQTAPLLPGGAVVPQLAQITGANIVRNDNDPDQLILEVSGNMPNSCAELGPIDYKVFGNTFRYTIPYVNGSNAGFCNNAPKPFTERYAINPAGQPLATGSYQLDLNGVLQPFNV